MDAARMGPEHSRRMKEKMKRKLLLRNSFIIFICEKQPLKHQYLIGQLV